MKMSDLAEELEKLAPPSYAESWDNVGLLVGSMDRNIESVYIALDADSAAVKRAAAEGCDLILTHHPLLFSAVKSIRADDFIGGRLLTIIENRMNYYAMHTNFDVAVMAGLTSSWLGLRLYEPLAMVRETPEGMKGIGCTGRLPEPMTLAALAKKVKENLGLPQVRYYGDPDRVVEAAALCPGSGKGMDEDVLAAGAQVFITGDVDHHYGLDLLEKGVCVIDAGHHGLEYVFVDYMARWISRHYPELRVVMDENQSPFHVV